MKNNVCISVSTMPIEDYEQIVDYAKFLQNKADFLHCDVMDGNFVEAYTYDASVVKAVNANSAIMLDVHLMIEKPEEHFMEYIDAGANILSLHYEGIKDKNKIMNIIAKVKSTRTLFGLAIKKETPFKEIKPYVYSVDLILIMGVEIGEGEQEFDPYVLEKIIEINEFRRSNNLNFKIEVDGGINDKNAKEIIEAGADIVVSGSFVFKSKNKQEAINRILQCE